MPGKQKWRWLRMRSPATQQKPSSDLANTTDSFIHEAPGPGHGMQQVPMRRIDAN